MAFLLHHSQYIVCHTGAGISTSCGIPDFRGPNGIWTLEKKTKTKGRKRKRSSKAEPKKNCSSFEEAIPSLTHMILKGLYDLGKLRFIVSQNVDGLHIRSGIPRAVRECFVKLCRGVQSTVILT